MRITPIAFCFLVFAASAQEQTETAMKQELAPFEKQQRDLQNVRFTEPARFLDEAPKLAERYAAIAAKYAKVSQSHGVEGQAVTLLTTAAQVARTPLKKPARALELYRRAAEIHARRYPGFGALAMNEQIADVYQFDLRDRTAAAAALEEIRALNARLSRRDNELPQWQAWRERWLKEEVAFLKTGKPFAGTLTETEVHGFAVQLYYGGAGAVYDLTLNPYEKPTLTPAQMEAKLATIPPSHAAFSSTWLFAIHLPTPAAARKWLDRNDPGGFMATSLLTLAALADRDAAMRVELVKPLVRTETDQPTAFALLAREWAKTHRLPTTASRRP